MKKIGLIVFILFQSVLANAQVSRSAPLTEPDSSSRFYKSGLVPSIGFGMIDGPYYGLEAGLLIGKYDQVFSLELLVKPSFYVGENHDMPDFICPAMVTARLNLLPPLLFPEIDSYNQMGVGGIVGLQGVCFMFRSGVKTPLGTIYLEALMNNDGDGIPSIGYSFHF